MNSYRMKRPNNMKGSPQAVINRVNRSSTIRLSLSHCKSFFFHDMVLLSPFMCIFYHDLRDNDDDNNEADY